jgi:type VI secretion system protein ImpH
MIKKHIQSELSPINKLKHKPQIFEFFQAVRVLTQFAYNKTNISQVAKKFPVGFDFDPGLEIVRFKAVPSLKFPGSDIASSHLPLEFENELNELYINFLGLYGPTGILPNHYSELIIQRLQHKDTSLRDFLDLFNHRIISLFYRSWEKYHFFVAYERAKHENKVDTFSKMLAALIGNGTASMQERTVIADESYLFYAGLLARQARSSSVLAAILADYFNLKVTVKEFEGKWLSLNIEDYTRLTCVNGKAPTYNQLGVNALLGVRTWNTQYHFKIKIGPLAYEEFLEFLPNNNKFILLNALTRRYIGINLNYDIQLILRAGSVPACSLAKCVNLGWSTWLQSKPLLNDVSDTVIVNEYAAFE